MTEAERHNRVALRFALYATAGIAALYLGTLALCASGVVADGYDGVGFVLAVDHFDLARFAPQPPGYPLFVLLGRLFHACGLRAALALSTVNTLLVAVGLGAMAGLLRVTAGRFAALLFLLLVPTAPLVYGLGMATLSDGAGLGGALLFALLSLRALSQNSLRGHALAGVVAGVALGIRPPLLPLLGLIFGLLHGSALLRKATKMPASFVLIGASAATVLLWLLPFAYVIGFETLAKLSWQHARGHFADFGGTVFVETAPFERLRDFFSGLLGGSFGRYGWLLIAPALVGFLVSARRASSARRLGAQLGVLLIAYAVWALLALPTSGHGRHLLPLSVVLGALVALGLSALPRHAGVRFALAAVVAFFVVDNGRAVLAFRGTPPPGAQLSAYAAKMLPEDRLYGARAARYLDLSLGSGSARPAIYLGEVLASLERESHLPAEVLVTSEVLASPASRPRLKPLARFCYLDAVPRVLRFDRSPHRQVAASAKDGCVDLLAYRVRP